MNTQTPDWERLSPAVYEVLMQPDPTPTAKVMSVPSGDDTDRATRYVNRIPGSSEGTRNNDLNGIAFLIAEKFRLTEKQVLAICSQWNARCSPPQCDRDLMKTVRSAYESADKASKWTPPMTAKNEPVPDDPTSTIRPQWKTALELVRENPNLKPPIIHGILREEEVMGIIGAPKSRKSWTAMDLALSISAGAPWMGHETVQGKVLYIDNELHPQTTASRLPRIAEARGIALTDNICVENLRGRLVDIYGMAGYFHQIPPGMFKVIVLDALYRFMAQGSDENSNADMAAAFNALDAYAHYLHCAFALVHHSTKGAQGNKSVTDVGAGASSQARAVDCHLVLRQHKEDDVMVVDAAARSWPPMTPFAIRWSYPIFNLAPEYNTNELRTAGRQPKKEKAPPVPVEPEWTPERFTETYLPVGVSRTKAQILAAASKDSMNDYKATNLLKKAVGLGIVTKHHPGGTKPDTYLVCERESILPYKENDSFLIGKQNLSLKHSLTHKTFQIRHGQPESAPCAMDATGTYSEN